MIINTGVIEAYQRKSLPDEQAWFYQKYGRNPSLSLQRQAVCERLCDELRFYEHFPLWNQVLILTLFPQIEKELANMEILAIIGSDQRFDGDITMHDGKTFLVVDLLNIADYTQSVKEMTYILHNQCHYQLIAHVLKKQSATAQTFQEQMAYRFFVHGLALYASWNEDYHAYVFHEPQYAKRKAKAFYMYHSAMHNLTDEQERQMFLRIIRKVELWERYPDIAGLFFVDALMREEGIESLKEYVKAGWENVAKQSMAMHEE
ncbi:MAG: hypothetical protein HFE68_04240 [Erysipelotrichaceae bacterium]|nr:hypothetical protein [Erysipelotrichaceae bacterium]